MSPLSAERSDIGFSSRLLLCITPISASELLRQRAEVWSQGPTRSCSGRRAPETHASEILEPASVSAAELLLQSPPETLARKCRKSREGWQGTRRFWRNFAAIASWSWTD